MKNSKIISILASAVSVGAIAAGAFMFWKKKSQKEKSHLKHPSADSKTTDHERQDEGAEKANEHSKSSSKGGGGGKNLLISQPHITRKKKRRRPTTEKQQKKDRNILEEEGRRPIFARYVVCLYRLS
ncbi:MAG: hypothetical protein IPP67_04550 [Rhodospirillaceae bacterium]|nr:hypothetical protein [Rhodospirillaceae bacterium]